MRARKGRKDKAGTGGDMVREASTGLYRSSNKKLDDDVAEDGGGMKDGADELGGGDWRFHKGQADVPGITLTGGLAMLDRSPRRMSSWARSSPPRLRMAPL